MNQKSLIAVLGVVVVILIGTTVYFATINKAVVPAPRVVQQPVPTPAPAVQQPSVAQQQDQSETSTVQPIVDKTTGWQKFNYTNKGVAISIPKGWENQSADNNNPLFTDGKNQINVSFPGDEEARGNSTGKQEVERTLATASSKTTPIESVREDNFIREDLTLGNNTVYKLYHPPYLKGLEGSSYDIRLKNNNGFVEFFISQGANEAIIKSILEKVEIY